MLPQYFCCMFTILCLRSIWLKIFFFLTCSTISVVHLERKASVFHQNLFYCPMTLRITKFSLLKAKVKMQPVQKFLKLWFLLAICCFFAFLSSCNWYSETQSKGLAVLYYLTCLVGTLHNCLLIAMQILQICGSALIQKISLKWIWQKKV